MTRRGAQFQYGNTDDQAVLVHSVGVAVSLSMHRQPGSMRKLLSARIPRAAWTVGEGACLSSLSCPSVRRRTGSHIWIRVDLRSRRRSTQCELYYCKRCREVPLL